jgi:2-oxoglutarate dehydrogenase E1 component
MPPSLVLRGLDVAFSQAANGGARNGGEIMARHDQWERFYGPNAGYVLELYERYQADPASVDAATRAFFEQAAPEGLAGDGDGGNGAVAVMAPAARPAPTTNGAAKVQVAPPAAVATRHGSDGGAGLAAAPPGVPVSGSAPFTASSDVAKIVGAARLARSIREFGHLAADIDPLGMPRPGDPMLDPATHGLTDEVLAALPASIVWRHAGPEAGTCLDAIGRLRAIYSGSIGYDLDHIQDYDERAWLHDKIETGAFRAQLDPEDRRALLQRLTEVEGFERFLHTTFQGQKRFSIEGCDTLVPMLDELVRLSAVEGTREVLIGMAHRGRLNVLAHVLGKPYGRIFAEFHHSPNRELVPSEGSSGINYGWTGDVKYHLGARKTVRESELVPVTLTLAHNPSHLEFVNPVIVGFTRAAQDRRDLPGAPRQEIDCALAVAIHGDAAFPGEGVVAETLNMSHLPGYQVGGTIHIIVNNQIGFTTGAQDARSTIYASDLAKGFEIPIVHVNADDPEACLAAVRLAHAYRQRFHRDFLIDLVGYRRLGHNEGDEPSFTQPLMYARVGKHPTVRALYAMQLASLELVAPREAEQIAERVQERLKQALVEAEANTLTDDAAPLRDASPLMDYRTAVPAEQVRAVNAALLARPAGFVAHERLERILARRGTGLEKAGGIDWGHAEALAFGSLLLDGIPIRLTGQDSERGTFVQRHGVLTDVNTGAKFAPLGALPGARASFALYNSPLSEAAVLGFEYGYSIHAPETLVLWEAQFGDFANAGQVLIDQFLVAARAKWRQEPGLVLLLPHGYEGQGPEHSSGRLERFLQLAAEDNLRIANPTTAAQYFHLLRAQAQALRDGRRPLVVMTPKSLLRHPRAGSSLADLTDGGWRPVLDDADATARLSVGRLVLCSGKVGVDLATSERRNGTDWVAVARVEQLYPFPAEEIERVIDRYQNLREVVWLQEEPQNMGAWNFVMPHLTMLLAARDLPLRYIGRPERASTAEGAHEAHEVEQARIIGEAFTGEKPS